MLRASSMTTETDINLQGVNGDQEAATLGIKHGKELMLLGEAVATRNQDCLKKHVKNFWMKPVQVCW
ncbi:MAG: hypothetical protein CM1200mP40_17690 [Gammaproteobacteria bacterium]|nr:MAG: hypothetical protein CM1200mP40_17690 [Gammaproteobacteria bacterium]